jgi:hypothetical protein
MGCHFNNIASLVGTNARHLEDLELELQGWSPDRESRESTLIHHEENPEVWDKIPASTILARQMFGLEVGATEAAGRTQFPKLRSFRLTRVPLRDENTGIQVTASSIDLKALRHLSLRMCAYWMPFLTDMMESQGPLQLETLEILDFYLDTPHETATSKAATITEFIDSFKGLEELFISVCGPTPSLQFWEHVAGHAATLKKFVYHQRLTDQDEDLLNSRSGRDSSDLGISSEDRDSIRQVPSQNPLSRLNLEFIGLTCASKYLVSDNNTTKTQLLTGTTERHTATLCSQAVTESASHSTHRNELRSQCVMGFQSRLRTQDLRGRKRRRTHRRHDKGWQLT